MYCPFVRLHEAQHTLTHFFAFMKIVNLTSHSIYFYIFRMLPVNELTIISPEWRTTDSLPGHLPTEAATGSRPKKMYYTEANPYYLYLSILPTFAGERGFFLHFYYYYSFPVRFFCCDHSARWGKHWSKRVKKHCLLVSVHIYGRGWTLP